MTRALLLLGAIAGPIYVFVVVAQVLTRDGFEITRHPVSLLSNGEYGWVQILNFVLVGTLVLAAAAGLRRAMSGGHGVFSGPVLLALFGVGLIGSGVFIADPANGFPPGTPAGDPVEVTTGGILHFAFGGIAFVSFAAACLVFARRYSQQADSTMAIFSATTGIIYLVAFVLVAATAGAAVANILLTVAVLLGWIWLTLFTSGFVEQQPAADDQNISPVAGGS